MSLLNELDAHIGFSCEKIPEHGEDSWCYSFNERAGMMGVFDGCGGLGAASYPELSGKTGAYLASRAAAGAVMDWFQQGCEDGRLELGDIKDRIMDNLNLCVKTAKTGPSKFRGSMVRLMPTTGSIWIMEAERNRLRATSISAGDSRNYILCSHGLLQISADDLSGEDAMSNLYNDAPMTNVISADGQFTLSCRRIAVDLRKNPCILMSATDGCFGYLPSPMEFEALLLRTMLSASSPAEWEAFLQKEIGAVAGDDQSLSMAAFGFDTFENMKKSFAARGELLSRLTTAMGDSTSKRWAAWDVYKSNYYCLTEGGIPARG